MKTGAILLIYACLLACPERQCEIIQVESTVRECGFRQARLACEATPPGYEPSEWRCREVRR